MKNFTSKAPTSSAQPDLAVRLRQCAAIFTRAACLLARRATYPVNWPTGGVRQMACRSLTLQGLIKHAKSHLYHEARKKVPDVEPNEGAINFAFALLAQDPINMSPPLGKLIKAAHKLREWAAFEEAVIQWATPEPVAPRQPAHYVPFQRNGAWIYTMPYGISDKFRTEVAATLHADRTREEDELARRTAESLRQPEELKQEVAA